MFDLKDISSGIPFMSPKDYVHPEEKWWNFQNHIFTISESKEACSNNESLITKLLSYQNEADEYPFLNCTHCYITEPCGARKLSNRRATERFGVFSRGHTTLHLAVSVGRSVGWSVDRSVGLSHFWIPSGFRTAPAKPSATGLPCIRPCST